MKRWILPVHLSILAGCANLQGPLWGSAPSPFTPEFYRSSGNAPLATPLPPVAVYPFVDKRSVPDPTFIGEHPARTGTHGRSAFYASEPVATGVARAFVHGLRERGFQVLDRTMTPLRRERAEESVAVISGEVLEFSSSSRRTGLVSYEGSAAYHIRVQVYGREVGEVRWEKAHLKTSDAFIVNSQLVFLSRSLAETVDEAVNDPAFRAALRRNSE